MSIPHVRCSVSTREMPARALLSVPFTMAIVAAFLLGGSLTAVGQQLSSTQIAGGSWGRAFTDTLPSAEARVAEVRVRAGDAIDAIQVVYTLPDGRTAAGTRHGGSGGREYVTAISGRSGDLVDSLRIHTNKRTSQLIGGSDGIRDYHIEVPAASQAVGFSGRAGQYLDAIGLIYSTESAFRRRSWRP